MERVKPLVLEPDPLPQAALQHYQCPVCGLVNAHVPVLGVTRRAESGVWNGKEYQLVELYELQCKGCRTHYYQKKYV